MKDNYTIHEIAELYGVGSDALRYYERLGLVRPRRGPNGYRLYGLTDIYRLTIIRDLRQLGFSMERIGEYLEGLSVSNTLALLGEEQALIRQRQRQLRAAEKAIRARTRHLETFARLPAGQVWMDALPERPCVKLNADITRDEEVDLAIKKLHHRHADTIRDLGAQLIGTGMRLEDIERGVVGLYHSVFFVLEPGARAYDFRLSGGRYARLIYRGSYRQCGERVAQLLDWTRQVGCRPAGEVLELYHIDNRFTRREEEFVTELQLRLEAVAGDPGAATPQ